MTSSKTTLAHRDADADATAAEARGPPMTSWLWRESTGILADLEEVGCDHRTFLRALRYGDWDLVTLRRAATRAAVIAEAYDHALKRAEHIAAEQRAEQITEARPA